MGTFPGIPLAGAGLFREGKGSPMSANDRIIRDEADEDGIFDAPTAHAPRIDLILGVSLAIVASVLGVLGSLGFGSVGPPRDRIESRDPVAIAQPDGAPALDPAQVSFDVVDEPTIVKAPQASAQARVDERIVVVDHAASAVELTADAERRDGARRMVEGEPVALDDDPEFGAAIESLRAAMRTLVERAETLTPAARRTTDLRRLALPTPPRRLGL